MKTTTHPHPDWLRTHPVGLGCLVAWVPEYHVFRLDAPANDDWPPEAA